MPYVWLYIDCSFRLSFIEPFNNKSIGVKLSAYITVITLLKNWTNGSKNPMFDSWITAFIASFFDFPNLWTNKKLSTKINPSSFQVLTQSFHIEQKILLLYLTKVSSLKVFPITLYENIM